MMMFDVLISRQTVLEVVLEGLHIPREVYELRYSLFVRAAKYYFNQKKITRREILEPFPPCFYDFSRKIRRYQALHTSLSTVPELSDIDNMTSLPEQTWALLCWIFTNPLKIEVVKQSDISEFLTDVRRHETNLWSIPSPCANCSRFEISHEPNLKKTFLTHKDKFGSFFAYHGSPGYNFHSIVHRGLRCSLNVTRAYGYGTYLTSYLETATAYATQYDPSYSEKKTCRMGRIKYCVAVVEVIKHPSVTVVNRTAKAAAPSEESKFEDTSSKVHLYYVVDSDELMLLRHLLVFYY